MGIETAISGLGAVGSIAGSLGKGKDKQEVSESKSGFQAMPKEIQDFMLQTLFPDIQSYYSKPYQGLPKRPLDTSDTDPIYGSQRRVQYDKMMTSAPKTEAIAPEVTKPASTDLALSYLTEALSTKSGPFARVPGHSSAYGGINPTSVLTEQEAINLLPALKGGDINLSDIARELSKQGYSGGRAYTANWDDIMGNVYGNRT